VFKCTNINVGQSSAYLAKDNYYTQEEGLWYGKGAEALGLSGEVAHKDFESLEHGFDPVTGKKLVSIEKRGGTDLTFSAPKSISIAYEIGDEQTRAAVLAAHQAAVFKTLDEVQNYSQMREQKFLTREIKNTNNLVISAHTHDTNRELEPQLHTHAFVFNMTQDENGKWRALHNDAIVGNEYYFGQIYHNQLALELKKAGFEIESVKVKATYVPEIKGITQNVKDAFSKRTAQIQELLPKLKEQYPQATQKELLDMAALSSRKSKIKEVDRDEVRRVNQELAVGHGVTSNFINSLKSNEQGREIINVTEAVKLAMISKTENEALFTKEDLTREALAVGMQSGLTLSDIKEELNRNKEILITDTKDKIGRSFYTSQDMQNSEKRVIELALEGKDVQNALIENPAVSLANCTADKNIQLTQGQTEACSLMLESKDRFIIVQGDAGTGKTFMVHTAKEVALQNGANVEFVGLAPTGKAVDGLKNESGIDSFTVDEFLLKPSNIGDKQRIYVVDEAGMIGTKNMEALLEKAKVENAKVVLIGDRNQFKAVTAGDAFGKLQDAGIRTAKMEEVMRQKEGTTIKAAVTAFKRGDTDKALKHLEKDTKEGEFSTLKAEIVKDYLQTPDTTLIIASTNTQAAELNEAIRQELVKTGKIEVGESKEIYQTANVSGISKHIASSYEVGQIIEFQKVQGFKGGEKLEIKEINKDSNKLIFANGKELDLSQTFQASVYQKSTAAFADGDKVIFLKKDKESGVKNGETAVIKEMNGSKMTIIKNEKEVVIDTDKFKHFTHGYAVTDYKSQGMTVDKIIISANAAQASKNALYVQLTRAKSEAKLYTDNIEKLREKIKVEQQKTSAVGSKMFDELKRKFEQIASQIQTKLSKSEKSNEYANDQRRRTGYLDGVRSYLRDSKDKLENALGRLRNFDGSAAETVHERLADVQYSKDGIARDERKIEARERTVATADRGRDEAIQRDDGESQGNTRGRVKGLTEAQKAQVRELQQKQLEQDKQQGLER